MANPINNEDAVNKIYIDKKNADTIKRIIQNDDYISFLDHDNNEYKLKRYREVRILTDETLFQLRNLENRTNTKRNYGVLYPNGSDLLSSLSVPRNSGMYSGGLINKEDDT